MMKANLILIFLSINFFGHACNSAQEKDDFNENICTGYEKFFFKKYQEYQAHNTKANGGDFLSYYISFCKIETCKYLSDYHVIQAHQIYTAKDSIVNSTFEYELLHFNKSNKIDAVIKEIKNRNCIDERTLKIHRIYRIGRNTVICVNYFNFDITEYENFLFEKFDKNIKIEIINISN